MIFKNVQVPIDQLPRAEAVQFTRLNANYIRSELIALGLLFGTAGFILLLFTLWNRGWEDWYFRLYWGIWAGLATGSVFLAFKNFAISGYAIRQRDILFRSGVIFRTVTTIPFNRVQHCEITEGPVDKLFGLATLKVYTAGGSSSDLTIPGLTPEEAHRIKTFITRKTGADEEE